MSRRVAILGFGAIGAAVADGLSRSARGPYRMAVLRRSRVAGLPAGVEELADLAALQVWKPGLVVEAAGQEALRALAKPCLAGGIAVLACSVGALADDALLRDLTDAARKGGARLILPSGAVASIDYLTAVAGLPDARVTYESRKPPSAWRDVLAARSLDPDGLGEEVVLFAGPAREAARLFPQNLNVAATLALAGIGMDATQVRVVVDPRAAGNTHTIHVTSAAGEMRTQLVNRPSPANPKTSLVTALSAVASVESFFAPLVIG